MTVVVVVVVRRRHGLLQVLAAQLFNELKAFFPSNAVEYFVSFYDFYLPESYSPTTDRFTDKVSDTHVTAEFVHSNASQHTTHRHRVHR